MVKIFDNGVETEKEVEFFTWEKLDYVDKIKAEFGIL
jgi:S-adenosylmethionine synthetase